MANGSRYYRAFEILLTYSQLAIQQTTDNMADGFVIVAESNIINVTLTIGTVAKSLSAV